MRIANSFARQVAFSGLWHPGLRGPGVQAIN